MYAALCPPLSQHALHGPYKQQSPPHNLRLLGAGEGRVKGSMLPERFSLKAVGGFWQVALFSVEAPVAVLRPLQHKQLKHECVSEY